MDLDKYLNDAPPFSMAYVLRVTSKHVGRSIDISIDKTFGRLKDFKEDATKSREVMETLSNLHIMKRMHEEFVQQNNHLFKD